MLKSRLISAFFLISGSLFFVGLDAWATNFGCPGLWLLPLGFYLVFGSAIECLWMVSRSPIGSITAPASIGTGLVMLAGCLPLLWPLSGAPYPADCEFGKLEWPLLAAILAMIGSCAYYFRGFVVQTGSFQRAILAGWISCYFGICFSVAIAVRTNGSSNWGLFVLMGFIVVTKLADTGAYFTGRALGRTKLCPSVSPNKTVEGLMGGVLLASLGAWLYFRLFAGIKFGEEVGVTTLFGIISIGLSLTLAGLVGDLLESVFKREFGCKDSGKMLPGLGGLWDVTDSILPAMVVGYVILRTGVIGCPVQL